MPPGAALVSVAASKLGSSEDGVNLHSYHESLHYQYSGVAGERLPFSTALDQCTGSCRGHAALAIHSCQEWLREGKQTTKARFTCRTAITEMHSMCGSSRSAAGEFCAGGKSSYTLKPHQSHDDHDCEVCGIHHMYVQHGALGGPDMYTHKELQARMDTPSSYTMSEAYNAKRLSKLQRSAVLAELGDIHDEAGLGEHVEKEQLHSIARTFMDGTGSDADMELLAAHADAKAAAKVGCASISRGLSLVESALGFSA